MAVTLNAKGTSVSSFTIGKGGQAITLNANGYLTIDDGVDTEQPIGYNTIPIYEIDANDTFDLAHAGMMWHKDAGAAVTFTCDNDSTIPQGSTWIVHNDDTEDLTIAEGTGVTIAFLASGAAPATGNVTVSQGGIVTVYKYTDTEYWVWGDDGPFNILTAGSTTDSTLRWNGSAWAENTTITATSTGVLTAASTAGEHTFSVDSATTNADIPVVKLSASSTGTPAAGIGPSIQFEAETAAANLEIGGEIALEATDVTATTEDFDFVFNLMAAGAAATEAARITSTGSLFLPEKADADADVAGYGQIWVDLATPNTLYFTDDAGTDHLLNSGGTVTSVDITAGTLIDKTGGPITSSGSITIDVDLSEATEAVYAPATDYLLFLDGGVTGTAAKESGADFATALAGTGLTASGGVINRDTIALTTDTSGDYVATITGGTGIDSTGATTGEGIAHTLSVDLGEVTAVVFDPATDYIPIIDGSATGTTQKDAWADIATAIAGTGITATAGVLSADNNGTVTGTGSNNRIATWSGTSSLDSSANLTYDGTTLTISGAGTQLLLQQEDDAATPTIGFGTGDTGIFQGDADTLSISTGAAETIRFHGTTVQTTTATQTEIIAIGVTSGTSIGFEALVIGREDATGDTVMEKITGLISNEAGTTALIGTPGVDRHEAAGASTWAVTVAADDTTDELTFDVTGQASHTIDWKIRVEVIEV